MAFAVMRLLYSRTETVCFAFANAASVASLFPIMSGNARLPMVLSSHTLGAPSFAASSTPHRCRQRLVVDLDLLGGDACEPGVSATTKAMRSPT